ncbi:MAG: leucine-rich repeat domain-containing protein [Ruminococcaceae bacterium]|nr:leucine-rich repeat domain-containing protein [Oscillospiraceae bacterium]
MTSSKRIFCIIFSLVFVISAMITVSAEDTTQTSGDFSYTVLDDGTVGITGYNGNDTDVVIPSEIDGKTVSSIGNEIFWYHEELTSVVLPENLEHLGERVFSYCSSLTEITLPETLSEIGDACFLSCSKLSKINVPAGLAYVGAFAFEGTAWITQFDGCSSVILGGRIFYQYLADESSVVIPDGIICISGNAFENKSLSYVGIPDSVAFIGDYAFYNCKNLKEIRLPSSIYYLGDYSLGLLAGTEDFVEVKDFVIYAESGTLGAEYASYYDITLKDLKEFTEPAQLPEAEVCVPTGEIREADKPAVKSAGLNSGDVVTIVLIIAGCVIIIGGVAVASYYYEKKRKKLRKEKNQNFKKKKK